MPERMRHAAFRLEDERSCYGQQAVAAAVCCGLETCCRKDSGNLINNPKKKNKNENNLYVYAGSDIVVSLSQGFCKCK